MGNPGFKYGGMLNYPVRNKSENFELNCTIRFAVSGEAEVIDENKFVKTGGQDTFRQYMREKMSGIMKLAMRTTWGIAMPLSALDKPMKPLEEAICETVKIPLAKYGLRLSSANILNLSLDSNDIRTLNEHENREAIAEKMKNLDIGTMMIDEMYRPEKYKGPGMGLVEMPPYTPITVEPWDCSQCGRKNITSKFCPECGTPCPGKK